MASPSTVAIELNVLDSLLGTDRPAKIAVMSHEVLALIFFGAAIALLGFLAGYATRSYISYRRRRRWRDR